jgi:hypothetical protein
MTLDDDEPVMDPALCEPPVRPGSLIGFYSDGTYHGGRRRKKQKPRQAMDGEVVYVRFDGADWWLYTLGGWKVKGSQVYDVAPAEERTFGSIRAVRYGKTYRVKSCGLDGQGCPYAERVKQLADAGVRYDNSDTAFAHVPEPLPIVHARSRPLLRDLTLEQRAVIREEFGLSPATLDSLVSGKWTDETFQEFWQPATSWSQPAIISVGKKIATIVIETTEGKREVKAWAVGALAIHRAWGKNISGWSVSHRPTGTKVASRLLSKQAALDLAQRLLALSSCDWASVKPIPAAARSIVLQLVSTAPSWSSRERAPPTGAPSP